MTAFPRVIHKGLGVYWGVSHHNSGHSMSQAAWVTLVFGFTSLCIYLCYRSYTKTPPLHLPLAPRLHLLWGSGIVYRVILHSWLHWSLQFPSLPENTISQHFPTTTAPLLLIPILRLSAPSPTLWWVLHSTSPPQYVHFHPLLPCSAKNTLTAWNISWGIPWHPVHDGRQRLGWLCRHQLGKQCHQPPFYLGLCLHVFRRHDFLDVQAPIKHSTVINPCWVCCHSWGHQRVGMAPLDQLPCISTITPPIYFPTIP